MGRIEEVQNPTESEPTMITRYVIQIETTDTSAGEPRRLQMTFLSAGGNNISAPNGERVHKLSVLLEGEQCPVDPPEGAHYFVVTPTSYNEWAKKVREWL